MGGISKGVVGRPQSHAGTSENHHGTQRAAMELRGVGLEVVLGEKWVVPSSGIAWEVSRILKG